MESSTFTQFVAHELNPEQREAVTHAHGVLLVCAGAGSGKTRVITARITHLILEHGVRPEEIVALTFTNKAAKEMRERIARFLPSSYATPAIGTFHSYCVRLLKTHRQHLPFPSFSILDEADQLKIIQRFITAHALDKRITPKTALAAISRMKNEAVLPELVGFGIQDPVLQKIYQAYEQEKRAAHAYDFDDLLLETLSLFKRNDELRERYQRMVRD